MPDLVLKKQKTPSWVSYIKQRIKKNKNFLGFISGQTGSGKSYAGMSICEMCDPEFNAERIIFSGKELLSLINSGKLKKGSAILFDEAGIDLSNRSWQSVTNKLLNFLLQTFRHRNFILIFTSPYLDFVDAATRKLFHAEFSTVNIDFKRQTTKIKPQLIQYNGRLRKFYYKYLRVISPNGSISPIRFWHVPKPSNDLLKQYEKKKTNFTDKLNKSIELDLAKLEGKKSYKPLTDKQEEILEYLKMGKTPIEISKIMGVHSSLIYTQINNIRKKGYRIMKVKRGRNVIKYDVVKI